MRMGLCVAHRKLIEELRQDIAAAFTCLSGLIIDKESGGPSSGEILHSTHCDADPRGLSRMRLSSSDVSHIW